MLGELHLPQERCAPSGAPTPRVGVKVTCTNCERVCVYLCLCVRVCARVCMCVSVTRTFGDLPKKGVQKFEEVISYFVSVLYCSSATA